MCGWRFPDAHFAPTGGPALVGGDLEPSTILAAYCAGYFPWPHAEAELLWFSPDPRAILPIDGFHLSRRMERTLRTGRFRLTVDEAFDDVIAGCAERQEGTWITPGIAAAYSELHRLGWAHSFEAWSQDGGLAGGLYGLRVGCLFGAESMFFRARDASKAAMAAMIWWAEAVGVSLIDIQVLTPHTARMGGIEVSRHRYLERLEHALQRQTTGSPGEGYNGVVARQVSRPKAPR